MGKRVWRMRLENSNSEDFEETIERVERVEKRRQSVCERREERSTAQTHALPSCQALSHIFPLRYVFSTFTILSPFATLFYYHRASSPTLTLLLLVHFSGAFACALVVDALSRPLTLFAQFASLWAALVVDWPDCPSRTALSLSHTYSLWKAKWVH